MRPSSARCIDEIEAGQVFVNAMVASTPEMPFGGIKRSGYGRELSALGIKEFCNAKAVWVGLMRPYRRPTASLPRSRRVTPSPEVAEAMAPFAADRYGNAVR